jgi:hypothetical protein
VRQGASGKQPHQATAYVAWQAAGQRCAAANLAAAVLAHTAAAAAAVGELACCGMAQQRVLQRASLLRGLICIADKLEESNSRFAMRESCAVSGQKCSGWQHTLPVM